MAEHEPTFAKTFGLVIYQDELFLFYFEVKTVPYNGNLDGVERIVTEITEDLKFCKFSSITKTCCRFKTISDKLDFIIPITNCDEMMA